VLGDKEMVAMWAELLRLEADALRKAGRAAEAEAIERRAQALSPVDAPDTQ
jgi:hypothetical protein